MNRYKDFFDQDEWLTVQFALMWIFRGVAGADGKIDKEEQTALNQVISSADNFEEQLIKDVFYSIQQNPGIIFRQSINDTRNFRTGLYDTARILDQKVSLEEAMMYKKTLIAIGIFVANASGDGTNRKNISDQEVGTLSKLAHYLKLDMKDLQTNPNVEDILTKFDTE